MPPLTQLKTKIHALITALQTERARRVELEHVLAQGKTCGCDKKGSAAAGAQRNPSKANESEKVAKDRRAARATIDGMIKRIDSLIENTEL